MSWGYAAQMSEQRLTVPPTPPAQIIGESPSRGKSKWTSAPGRRMRAMLGKQIPWTDLFDLRPERWSEDDARERVEAWVFLHGSESAPLLLLGARVCFAFGIEQPEWLAWYRSPRIAAPLIAIPDPASRIWWTQGRNALDCELLLSAIARRDLPLRATNSIREEEEGQ